MKFWDKVDLWIEKKITRAKRRKLRKLRDEVKDKKKSPKNSTTTTSFTSGSFTGSIRFDKSRWKPTTYYHKKDEHSRNVTTVLFVNKDTLEHKAVDLAGHLENNVVNSVLREGGYL